MRSVLSIPTTNQVIVLCGAWGIGKTYLWKELSKERVGKLTPAKCLAILTDSYWICCIGRLIQCGAKAVVRCLISQKRCIQQVLCIKPHSKKPTPPPAPINDLYVSAFRVEDLNELKKSIVAAAVGANSEKIEAGVQLAKDTINPVLQRIGFGSIQFSINEVLPFVLTRLLKNRLLVLDDLERGDNPLSMQALMGFIDESSHLYNTQFLLIANTARLKQNKQKSQESSWAILHEKVIDAEIQLDPPAEEVCTVAYDTYPREWALVPFDIQKKLKEITKICQLKNVQVWHKILKFLMLWLDEFEGSGINTQGQIESSVLRRWLYPLALLTALHFRAIPEASTEAIQVVLRGSRENDLKMAEYFKQSQRGSVSKNPENHDWQWLYQLQDKLGIGSRYSEEFLSSIYRLLEIGWLEGSKYWIGEFNRACSQEVNRRILALNKELKEAPQDEQGRQLAINYLQKTCLPYVPILEFYTLPHAFTILIAKCELLGALELQQEFLDALAQRLLSEPITQWNRNFENPHIVHPDVKRLLERSYQAYEKSPADSSRDTP